MMTAGMDSTGRLLMSGAEGRCGCLTTEGRSGQQTSERSALSIEQRAEIQAVRRLPLRVRRTQ